ncbi:hypothetical protein CEXT_262761 [Caerostris extrusa]|uniref:Uncharacterized protein n=1 Tax=Caerostris extrusa TaxID=172846 RepID=A0AAV4WDW4_CAEEX|nr:hypothetical protein CEXT_262761 [Caerostris extrusa]
MVSEGDKPGDGMDSWMEQRVPNQRQLFMLWDVSYIHSLELLLIEEGHQDRLQFEEDIREIERTCEKMKTLLDVPSMFGSRKGFL